MVRLCTGHSPAMNEAALQSAYRVLQDSIIHYRGEPVGTMAARDPEGLAAMKQYRELADSTEPGPAHDLFEFLANEETEHKRELEKTYYELVHSGGV